MATKIKFNSKAIAALLKDPAVVADLKRRAEAIAAAAGEGYDAVSSEPRRRARAAVVTATDAAREDNAENNTLLRALQAGR